MVEEMCQTCKYHKQEGVNYYMCENEDSEEFGFETYGDDYCTEYESKYGGSK